MKKTIETLKADLASAGVRAQFLKTPKGVVGTALSNLQIHDAEELQSLTTTALGADGFDRLCTKIDQAKNLEEAVAIFLQTLLGKRAKHASFGTRNVAKATVLNLISKNFKGWHQRVRTALKEAHADLEEAVAYGQKFGLL